MKITIKSTFQIEMGREKTHTHTHIHTHKPALTDQTISTNLLLIEANKHTHLENF